MPGFKRFALLALPLLAFAPPAFAQGEGTPLLRVYIDTPYFYDFFATVGETDADGLLPVHLYIEGKEVGEADIRYDCANDTFEQTVTTDWTGNAAEFVPAALLALDGLYCG